MFKKKLLALLVATVFVFAMTGVGQATVATKQVNVNYSNIKLVVNGNTLSYSAAQEPFIISGVTYVPLRLAAEALNSDVTWQGATKTINIASGSSVEVNTLKMQLEQKNTEIASLKAQMASLQTQLNNCKNDLDDEDEDEDSNDEEDDFDDAIDNLKDDLPDDYDVINGDDADVDVEDITISGSYNNEKATVTIKVDLADQQDEWDDLDPNEVEDYIDDVIDAIQDELDDNDLDIDDFEITGKIKDTDSGDTLVEFTRDGDESTDFEW